MPLLLQPPERSNDIEAVHTLAQLFEAVANEANNITDEVFLDKFEAAWHTAITGEKSIPDSY